MTTRHPGGGVSTATSERVVGEGRSPYDYYRTVRGEGEEGVDLLRQYTPSTLRLLLLLVDASPPLGPPPVWLSVDYLWKKNKISACDLFLGKFF